VSLPLELEDYIPEVEDFYKKKHSGRKLQWYHHMSNGTVSLKTHTVFKVKKYWPFSFYLPGLGVKQRMIMFICTVGYFYICSLQ
jgi:hypothetical protein